MTKNLVIVESPAKAKTIEKFLGKDYKVRSSYGHIRDLPAKGMSIDIENNFTPDYQVNADKKKIVAELRKEAKLADTVWLASDEDREGEAIAWHISEILKLKDANTKRIVFHEITKPAIEAAVANPRKVNQDIVNAQQARRILDRLVGYELSPILWKKVQRGLSAGRVQSVAVRLIVERERQIKAFTATSKYRVRASFINDKGEEIAAELSKKLDTEDNAKELLESLKNSSFQVKSVVKKPGFRNSSPPFTTSTLQQEASRHLGYSVKQTMTLAQRLYEAGLITYMRTDSLNLSELAISSAANEISKRFTPADSKPRHFKTKTAGAQEAHEAIRPTNFATDNAGADPQQQKLYGLIWRRTISSQMAPAAIEKTTATINDTEDKSTFNAKGEIVTNPGWLKVYPNDFKDILLPEISEGEKLSYQTITADERYARPDSRYTEASLVKKLEELGIGRPSTYAPTISTIQDRGYIEKRELDGHQVSITQLQLKASNIERSVSNEITGADKNKLTPTDIAMVVTDFLTKFFPNVIDYDFTADIEVKFDNIAEGKLLWQDMIGKFYKPFKEEVKKAESISRKDAGGMRQLGIDPKSKRPVFARVGRYGPMVQIGQAEDEEKPRFAPMPSGKRMDSVTFEEAMEMFKLPRTVGKTEEGEEIIANVGRFGPYVKVGPLYVSIKSEDPFTIDEKTARVLIAEKKEVEANKHINTFKDGKTTYEVLNGRYGPYVTDGQKNAKIPKDVDPKTIDLELAKEMVEKAPVARKRSYKKKK